MLKSYGWVVAYSILVSAAGPMVLFWDLVGVGPMGFQDLGFGARA